jgi:pre-rRNA-processing protein TSR3
LSVFTWGHTFLDLNGEKLEKYATAKNSAEVVELQRAFM